jgi:hypothetical protein
MTTNEHGILLNSSGSILVAKYQTQHIPAPIKKPHMPPPAPRPEPPPITTGLIATIHNFSTGAKYSISIVHFRKNNPGKYPKDMSLIHGVLADDFIAHLKEIADSQNFYLFVDSSDRIFPLWRTKRHTKPLKFISQAHYGELLIYGFRMPETRSDREHAAGLYL